MNIHEYQAKQILAGYGLALPQGILVDNAAEAVEAAKKIKSNFWVLKAQVHAGGRGKAGGVKLAKTLDEVGEIASQMLGMTLVTPQTGQEGKEVRKIYVEASSHIKKEYYVSLVLDRDNECITIAASTEGGMEIEEVAKESPEKILKVHVDPTLGIQNFHITKLVFGMGFDKTQAKSFTKVIKALYNSFVDTDASQIEINPLIEDDKGEFIPLDAKFNFDDNAIYRHKDIEAMRDLDEENPQEIQAKKFDLSYIKMDGSIGCMVNGAGLAMATMDIIKLYGGNPANFLDVGGGATTEKVTEAFKIILSDKNVKGILVNIFGGIMKCDIIANGIVFAAKDVKINVPLVVRLEGTNAEIGKRILEESGLRLEAASDLGDAARKIVNAIS
ncbi:ADP-forming succinate--CoA ligase subunit beta [Candidatus Bandiella euplotis]|uniref:Succinate--CoA ligase [ADP-forming] subunit beta n=1 Tax=Candidatus Bandiella euplotis TaxID=1664265 RepID=A0ABZ0UN59_9RICK|nr:ADP-forming succinate--CoA ligase subunit beta [Candidatus Bandiella woodruffii]WPX97377.1 Succinyl-CoA ligase [ADP-forming] subunit beta [Candidatus Bandiella woodruffii]